MTKKTSLEEVVSVEQPEEKIGKKTIRDIDIRGKRVLMRVDFNVPMNEDGSVADDNRIRAALPTIEYARSQGARVILMSHLGRPDGKVVESLRLAPCGKRLGDLLRAEVKCLKNCVGFKVMEVVKVMSAGDVILLENTRFYPEEEVNDPEFAKKLAMLADIFVNDAFGTVHRAHASTEGVAHYLPAVAGLLVAKEVKYLGEAVDNPKRPLVAILGGAKVKDKIKVIKNLLDKVDALIIGGAMAYTFLKATGKMIGDSKFEEGSFEKAKELLKLAEQKKVPIHLPMSHIATNSSSGEVRHVSHDIPYGWKGMDIGPTAIYDFKLEIGRASTIIWNGPLGLFENPKFAQGTLEIAQFIANLEDTITVIGGGDTARAIAEFGLSDKMTHVSTGGGASLEYLEGRGLPGIDVLLDK
jgi:phosphoglycerate kinase